MTYDMMMDYLHSLFYSDVVFCQGIIDCATGTTVSVSPSKLHPRRYDVASCTLCYAAMPSKRKDEVRLYVRPEFAENVFGT
jgi:hypothetical protein